MISVSGRFRDTMCKPAKASMRHCDCSTGLSRLIQTMRSRKAFAAYIYALQHTQTWTTADDISKGGRLAHEALVSSRDEPTTIAFAAHPLAMLTRDYDTALAAMDRAVYLNPNSAQILLRSAFVRLWVSDTDRAIDEFSRSMRLSPVDPEIGYALGGLAYALLRKGDYEKGSGDAHRSAREMAR